MYDGPFILAPMVMEIDPKIQVENIWSILKLKEERGERKKKKHQSAEKENLKKVEKDSIQGKRDRQVRFQEMQVGMDSSNPTSDNIEREVMYAR